MKRLVILVLVSLPALAEAKPWLGITPTESTRADVVKKFGEPSKKVPQDGGKELIAYTGEKAIPGTREAQFTIASGKVEQIVVFPTSAVELSEVEETYGKSCAASEKPPANCYSKLLSDNFKTYFWYKKLGLVVFFLDDKKTVHSILFNAPAPAGPAAK